MDNVLPLGGDGDEIDLLEEIERTFAIKLPTDLSHCHTVGDLHRVLLSLIPHAERGKTGCLAAKAYFVLRRAIRKRDPARVIRPTTELANIVQGRFNACRLHRLLKEDTGLEMPAVTGSSVLFLISIGLPLASFAAHGWVGTLMALPISIGLLALSNRVGRFPTGLRTVGDLARTVAALNVAALASPNEPLREREIWAALQGVIRNDLGWDGSVSPTTRLFPE
jgi:hypothetical protein